MSLGPIFEVSPHGLTFTKPVELILPPPAQDQFMVVMLNGPDDQVWKSVSDFRRESDGIHAKIAHLSFYGLGFGPGGCSSTGLVCGAHANCAASAQDPATQVCLCEPGYLMSRDQSSCGFPQWIQNVPQWMQILAGGGDDQGRMTFVATTTTTQYVVGQLNDDGTLRWEVPIPFGAQTHAGGRSLWQVLVTGSGDIVVLADMPEDWYGAAGSPGISVWRFDADGHSVAQSFVDGLRRRTSNVSLGESGWIHLLVREDRYAAPVRLDIDSGTGKVVTGDPLSILGYAYLVDAQGNTYVLADADQPEAGDYAQVMTKVSPSGSVLWKMDAYRADENASSYMAECPAFRRHARIVGITDHRVYLSRGKLRVSYEVATNPCGPSETGWELIAISLDGDGTAMVSAVGMPNIRSTYEKSLRDAIVSPVDEVFIGAYEQHNGEFPGENVYALKSAAGWTDWDNYMMAYQLTAGPKGTTIFSTTLTVHGFSEISPFFDRAGHSYAQVWTGVPGPGSSIARSK